MSHAVGDLVRWNPGALLVAGETVSARRAAADGARRVLESGAALLDEEWVGQSADAEAVGLQVVGDSLTWADGRGDTDQTNLGFHAATRSRRRSTSRPSRARTIRGRAEAWMP